MSRIDRKQQLWLALGGILVTLLVAAVFTLGSLNFPIEPRQWNDIFIFFALSTFIVAALLVFGLILLRTLLRIWAERRAAQLGSRFKTKMVLGAMAISLLPVVFMFIISYALLNRTLGRWFPRPLEIAAEESQSLLKETASAQHIRLLALARQLPPAASLSSDELLQTAIRQGATAAWILNQQGKLVAGGIACESQTNLPRERACATPASGRLVETLAGGVELWEAEGNYFIAARAPRYEGGAYSGAVILGERTSPHFAKRLKEIGDQFQVYELQKQGYRAFKSQLLLTLFLFTLLLLFAATWFALFLSKQVTLPIQALAEGTREVSAGNFEYQVPEQAQDELGVLVRSFNQMTAQLRDSRSQIDEFTRNLQEAVQELDRRRKLMETILENIPTGVISIDASGAIHRVNPAVIQMFGEPARTARSLEDLVGTDAARSCNNLMRRSSRMGVASKELAFTVSGRVLRAAVTVSSLGPRRAGAGFVIVVDDLTELLRAQKSAAWQEVAQRIAHEIKNPLTPIQLSAQRLSRHLERRGTAPAGPPPEDAELPRLVQECAGLIEREVATLASLVNEFAQFVRFPAARLAPVDANAILSNALELFSGRLEGVMVRTSLSPGLPSIRADAELLRRVLVNLIDNAAEALEASAVKHIVLSTRFRAEDELVEISVADTGHGISPEDKDKLFLPHFSTKDRGTGLGLAIAARIISEHNGTIRVEDNSPVGSRFVIAIPVAEVPAAPLPAGD